MVRLRDTHTDTGRLTERQTEGRIERQTDKQRQTDGPTDRQVSFTCLKKEPPLLVALRREEGGFGRLKIASFECRAEGQDQID